VNKSVFNQSPIKLEMKQNFVLIKFEDKLFKNKIE